ncbi:MAG TPA: ABC transporter ATP-binding protein [Candidatus Saccharimonadales bacterium]|nr:ABC transporter ATP-binding protein [Candidatus Saccharimonadales bacterium]
MAEAAINIQKLSKRYGRSAAFALKDLTLNVKPGEIYGFLGPNGAGKSTTIRTLMNFIQPTSGQASILGKDIVRDSVEIKRSVGYLSSDMAMYPKLTGHQFLDYLSDLQGNVNAAYRGQLVRALKADASKRLGDLSRGNRQKFAIVQAFMHQPDVLILDEPSSGLDPLMQETFYELLREAKDRGAAVFMSSHILSEVQKVCDRVGIIREGHLIAERSIADLANDAAHTFEISFRGQPPLAELKRLKGVHLASHSEHQVTIQLRGDLPPLLALLAKHDVAQLEVRQLDLEELFMHFYSDQEPTQ